MQSPRSAENRPRCGWLYSRAPPLLTSSLNCLGDSPAVNSKARLSDDGRRRGRPDRQRLQRGSLAWPLAILLLIGSVLFQQNAIVIARRGLAAIWGRIGHGAVVGESCAFPCGDCFIPHASMNQDRRSMSLQTFSLIRIERKRKLISKRADYGWKYASRSQAFVGGGNRAVGEARLGFTFIPEDELLTYSWFEGNRFPVVLKINLKRTSFIQITQCWGVNVIRNQPSPDRRQFGLSAILSRVRSVSRSIRSLFGDPKSREQDDDSDRPDNFSPHTNAIEFLSSRRLPFLKSYLSFAIGPIIGWPLYVRGRRLSRRGFATHSGRLKRRSRCLMRVGLLGLLSGLFFFGSFFLAQLVLSL